MWAWVAGAIMAFGCKPPEVANDVYKCTIDIRSVDGGATGAQRQVPYTVQCRALRTRVKLENLRVSLSTRTARDRFQVDEFGGGSLPAGEDVPSGEPVEVLAGQTWTHEGQVVVTEERPRGRSSMVRIEQCLRFVATPSFPDDPSITDENRKRSPNDWKWSVVVSRQARQLWKPDFGGELRTGCSVSDT